MRELLKADSKVRLRVAFRLQMLLAVIEKGEGN